MGHHYDLDDNEQWAPVSDLMAGLMLIFMLIAVIYFQITVIKVGELDEANSELSDTRSKLIDADLELSDTRSKLIDVDLELSDRVKSEKDLLTNAKEKERLEAESACDKIYYELEKAFGGNFKKWQAKLFKDLTIRFSKPEVLFPAESAKIRPYFEGILSDFFPRYATIIHSYLEDVSEVRIEGHASKEYGGLPPKSAYMKNMKLSQNRARAILEYVLFLPKAENYQWILPVITANGLSSSKLVFGEDGISEDKEASRRVEFRILAASCQKAGRQ